MRPPSQSASAPEGGTPALTLESPDPAFAVFPLTAAQLAEWKRLYDTEPRQIRRWIDMGRRASDPCPINAPARLVEWWPRHHKHRVPDALLQAAQAARLSAPPPTPSIPACAGNNPPVTVPSAPPPLDPGASAPINLADFQLVEGEVVRNQRSIVAAIYSHLKTAYETGAGNIDLLQGRYNKAAEALRKLEKDDREDARLRGQLIPRATVQRDIDTATELIRQMTETEVRRVLELCPSLGPDQRAEIVSAIQRVSGARTRVLRRLDCLKSVDDALLELIAA